MRGRTTPSVTFAPKSGTRPAKSMQLSTNSCYATLNFLCYTEGPVDKRWTTTSGVPKSVALNTKTKAQR